MNARTPSYTVVLTKGVHIVPGEDAEAILSAIKAGDKLVRVRLEAYPGSDIVEMTTLVTAHIIQLCEVPATEEEVAEAAGPNVRSLRQYRYG